MNSNQRSYRKHQDSAHVNKLLQGADVINNKVVHSPLLADLDKQVVSNQALNDERD